MIPKIIHYCWFGPNNIPSHLQKYMDTWKEKLPDYRIMRWDENSFDIESTSWTQEAYSMGKYAFVSDYVRLIALKQYGGIYLDTDVLVLKSFDTLLENRAFMGFENERYLSSAVMGFEANFPLLSSFLSYYNGRNFINEAGLINDAANVIMMTEICTSLGLMLNNSRQTISEMLILPREYFCPLDFYYNDHSTPNSITIHMFDASWLNETQKKMVQHERTRWYKFINNLKLHIKNIIFYH